MCFELLTYMQFIKNRFYLVQLRGNLVLVDQLLLFVLVSYVVVVLDLEYGVMFVCSWLGWLLIVGWRLIFDFILLGFQYLL